MSLHNHGQQKHFSTLRLISTVMAWTSYVLLVPSIFGFAVSAMLFIRLLFAGFQLLMPVWFLGVTVASVSGLVTGISLLAYSELILVLLAIEKNTRPLEARAREGADPVMGLIDGIR